MGFFDLFKGNNKQAQTQSNTNEQIAAPITGEVKSIKECADPVFDDELIGKVVLILPGYKICQYFYKIYAER